MGQINRAFLILLRRIGRVLPSLLCIGALLLLTLVLTLVLVAFRSYPVGAQLADIERYTNVLSNLMTVIGVLFAALWTYYHFARGRTFSTRADVRVEAVAVPLAPTHAVISVAISVKNIGRARLQPSSCCLTLNTIRPGIGGTLEVNPVTRANTEDIVATSGRQGVRYYLDPEETLIRETAFLVPLDANAVYQVRFDVRSRDRRCWTRTVTFRLGDRIHAEQ
ncbi:MAG: hypothetical protein HUU22_04550 [Phycisphaerae bacterium]|nr:hypothetical protein [Phycisphaerae bacterium]NUQ45285.1 hypothetical protein [Phycisphaerae bacterium]